MSSTPQSSVKSIKIESEKNVTVDEVVAEGDAIFSRVRAAMRRKENLEELSKELYRSHPQFAQSYPLALRYICDMQRYNSKAFRRWLLKIKEHPWKSEEEYIEAQADYVYKLICAENPRGSVRDKHTAKANLRKLLMAEHKEFKQKADDVEKQVDTREQRLHDRNVDELFSFLRKFDDNDLASIGTYRVIVDVDKQKNESLLPKLELPSAVDSALPVALADDLFEDM